MFSLLLKTKLFLLIKLFPSNSLNLFFFNSPINYLIQLFFFLYHHTFISNPLTLKSTFLTLNSIYLSVLILIIFIIHISFNSLIYFFPTSLLNLSIFSPINLTKFLNSHFFLLNSLSIILDFLSIPLI